jgi:hypothetical protein
VVAVTSVISAPEHALVVVHDWVARVTLSDTNLEDTQLTKAVWVHEMLLESGDSVGSSGSSGSSGSIGSCASVGLPPGAGGKLEG